VFGLVILFGSIFPYIGVITSSTTESLKV
jgi:hypothetical protein